MCTHFVHLPSSPCILSVFSKALLGGKIAKFSNLTQTFGDGLKPPTQLVLGRVRSNVYYQFTQPITHRHGRVSLPISKSMCRTTQPTRWFKVTFWSPSWRSLNPYTRSYSQKGDGLKHQAEEVSRCFMDSSQVIFFKPWVEERRVKWCDMTLRPGRGLNQFCWSTSRGCSFLCGWFVNPARTWDV